MVDFFMKGAAGAAGATGATGATGPAGAGGSQMSRVATATDVNGTTFASIAGLSATLGASKFYAFEIVIFCNNDTAAGGIKFDLNGGTATMTSLAASAAKFEVSGVTVAAKGSALASAYAFATVNASASAVIIRGSLASNAGGTFIPRVAENAAVDTAHAQVNSYMQITEIV